MLANVYEVSIFQPRTIALIEVYHRIDIIYIAIDDYMNKLWMYMYFTHEYLQIRYEL